jgi:tellurite resistance protein TehA-like permease
MAKRKTQMKHPVPRRSQGSWTRLLLALTTVPLVLGVLLIGAWALDLNIFDNPQSQTLVGILFILFSFAASNGLQRKRDLTIGWSLLTGADLVLLLWVEFWAQILALIAGVVGLGFVLVVFYRRWNEEQAKTKKKPKK